MAWISVSEARARLDGAVSVQTIYLLLRKGVIEGTRIGGKILVDSDSLRDQIAKGRIRLLSSRPGIKDRRGRRKTG